MKKKRIIILSCEHAVNSVPPEFQPLFAPFQDLLTSHRGIDFGALTIARHLKETFHCELVEAQTTRLLIDCCRSLHHRYCFSKISKDLPLETRQRIISQYYLPFRQALITAIERHIAEGASILHLSIHSFTPVLNGLVRQTDIGLLYDPRRTEEKALAKTWQAALKKNAPEYRVRMNYPYLGVSDGLTCALRKHFSPDDYLGIEIESNQALTQNSTKLDALIYNLSLALQ